MIVSLVVLSIALVTLWFALEGLRQRLQRLEQRLVDQLDTSRVQNPTFAQIKSATAANTTLPPKRRWESVEPIVLREPTTESHDAELGGPESADPREWEKLVGGNWLNKLGVVALVIGVGFLLRYSFGELGALHKILTGLAISLSMIGAGVVLERRSDFPLYYGRGLIGGGWAALYFTTYAAHGIESARIIESPTLATALLLAVGCGMIFHSLRYRSRVVTGLAYFLAFTALALTPMPLFAVVASVPLTISLLFVAYSFGWTEIAVAGLVVTYSTYIYSVSSVPTAWQTNQSVFALYWLIFEAFDLLSLATKEDLTWRDFSLAGLLFPLNACAFVGASILFWQTTMPVEIFFEIGALMFFVDALLRKWIKAALQSENSTSTVAGVTRGYEASLTMASVLWAIATFERFTGLRFEIALILEAEMLIIAGYQLELVFPRFLGSLLMLAAFSGLITYSFPDQHAMRVIFLVSNWSVVALITAGLFYVNRFFLKDSWKSWFGYAAAVLLVITIDVEILPQYIGLAWLALGVGLFEIGFAARFSDLRWQGYSAGVLGLLSFLLTLAFGDAYFSGPALAISTLLAWIVAAQMDRVDHAAVTEREHMIVRRLASIAGTALATLLLWWELPNSLLGVGWSLFAVALMSIGTLLDERDLRLQSYTVAALAFMQCWQTNFDITTSHFGLSDAVVTYALVIVVLYSASFFRSRKRPANPNAAENDFGRALSWIDSHGSLVFASMAIVLLTGLLYDRVDTKALTEAWALEALGLLAAGFVRRDVLSRMSGLALLGVCVLKLFFYDLSNLETLARIFSFIILGLLMLGVSLLYARFYESFELYFSKGANK